VPTRANDPLIRIARSRVANAENIQHYQIGQRKKGTLSSFL